MEAATLGRKTLFFVYSVENITKRKTKIKATVEKEGQDFEDLAQAYNWDISNLRKGQPICIEVKCSKPIVEANVITITVDGKAKHSGKTIFRVNNIVKGEACFVAFDTGYDFTDVVKALGWNKRELSSGEESPFIPLTDTVEIGDYVHLSLKGEIVSAKNDPRYAVIVENTRLREALIARYVKVA